MFTMLEITKKKFFKIKEVWFADYPFEGEVGDYDVVMFRECKNPPSSTYKYVEFSTLIIDLTENLENIWGNMSASSCRYCINKAIKSSIVVKVNQNHSAFCAMNKEFRRAKKLPIGVTGSIEFIQKYGTLFTAELAGEVLAGGLFLEDRYNIRWLLGASKRLDMGVDKKKKELIANANRLILWEAIKYAKEKGILEFDFGGYYTGSQKDVEKEGVNAFKLSFGGKLATRYNCEKARSSLVGLIVSIYRKYRK